MPDLRKFIMYLFEKGEIKEIKKKVSVNHEIAAYVRRSCDIGGPAFLFNNVKEFPKQQIVAGLYGTARRVNLAIGWGGEELTQQEALKKYIWAMENCWKAPLDFSSVKTYTEIENPPVKEVIIDEPDVDLDKIPIGKYCRLDSGNFITSGVQIVKDSVTGVNGYGIHRMAKLGKKTLGCLAPIERRIGVEHFRNSEKGIGTPIAIVFGGPQWMISSQAKLPFDAEKYAFARTLYGYPLTLTKCETSDILVPADAEMVIEGVSIPNSCIDESPFGEYTSNYSLKSNAWIVEVKKITHRKDYIMPFLLTGRLPNEDCFLCGPSIASHVWLDTKSLGVDIQNVSCYIGNCVFSTNVSIKKKTNAEVKNLLHRLLSNKYIKIAAVMDHDLNPDKEEDFRFALETRFQPDRDLITTDMMIGASLDPSVDEQNHTRKIGFDLTVPVEKDDPYRRNWKKHARVDVPGEKEVNW